MKTYRIEFADNSGSFAVDSIASAIGGRWWNSVQRFDGKNDLAFIDIEDDNVAHLEELLDSDDNVIAYGER